MIYRVRFIQTISRHEDLGTAQMLADRYQSNEMYDGKYYVEAEE